MEIKLLINNKAKKTIKNMKKSLDEVHPDNTQYIERWLSETNDVKCFILYENETIKSFALLSKMISDPFNKHTNPYILDFIYTFIQYRRNKLAYKLLLYMKDSNYMTAFCKNDESSMLFQKAEYVLTKYDENPNQVFRYP